MADTMDRVTRSRIMARIRARHTRPEVTFRRALHRLGLRYRTHDHTLPGKPDLVFPRWKAVVFVHGCFWHRHGCRPIPADNRPYWVKKFAGNLKRDRRNIQALIQAGWKVAVVWECMVTGRHADLDGLAHIVSVWLRSTPSG